MIPLQTSQALLCSCSAREFCGGETLAALRLGGTALGHPRFGVFALRSLRNADALPPGASPCGHDWSLPSRRRGPRNGREREREDRLPSLKDEGSSRLSSRTESSQHCVASCWLFCKEVSRRSTGRRHDSSPGSLLVFGHSGRLVPELVACWSAAVPPEPTGP